MMYIFHLYNFHTHFMKLPCVSVCVCLCVCEECAHSGLSYSKNVLNLKLVFSFILVFTFFFS